MKRNPCSIAKAPRSRIGPLEPATSDSLNGPAGLPARGARPVLRHRRPPRAESLAEAELPRARARVAWPETLRNDHCRSRGRWPSRPRWGSPMRSRPRPRDADRRHECAIQDRIPGARAHRLPPGMPDVDRRRGRGSKERGRDAPDAVDSQRIPGVEGAAGRFRRLDVLERAQHVEQTHRNDDR